ncbi:hypothetical protein ACSZMY_08265 [Aeromonas hydrophila]
MVTFDKKDSFIDSRIEFLPLFYIDGYAKDLSRLNNHHYQIAFIGTAHSGRYNLVTTIADSLGTDKKIVIYFIILPVG